MDITKFDVTILLVMSLAVVSMSFVMPALGLSDVDAEQSQVPELDVTNERFNLAGDRPRFPNTASSGSLVFNTTLEAQFSDNRIWLNGDTSEGYDLLMIEDPGSGNPQVILNRWDGGSVNESESLIINESSPRGVLSVGAYEIAITENDRNDPPDYLAVNWDINEQPGVGGSFVGRIPVIGTLFEGAEAVASVVGWFTIVFIWFSQTIVGWSLNVLGIVYDTAAFLVGIFSWLISTYATVVTTAPGWTSIFVALPGFILSLTLGKMVVIFIGLLPTT